MRILSLVTNDRSKFYRQQVAGLRDRGHDVDTIAVPGIRVKDGVELDSRPVSAYVRHYLRSVPAAIGSYDVVHSNYGLTAPPAVVQPFRPVVLSLWGSDVMGEYGWLSRICSRFADAVVVMSDEMAGVLDCDCHVIPHGVDLDLFRPLPQSAARAELGWDPDAHHVLFPYGASRGVKNFPRAERIVDAVRPDLDAPVELQTVTGAPHARMPWYMNAADAMVLTSKREGSPNSVKEALACNLPVVAVDVGDVALQVDGVSHSVVDDDDEALASGLLAALRAGERSDGREAIARLGIENQLDRIEAVYRSVARTGVGRA